MKKTIRTILSLLLVLVFAFQFSGSLAWADDADVTVTGKEALVYELYLRKTAGEQPTPVSAENESELLGGKSYAIQLSHKDSDASVTTPLSRTPGSIELNSLLKEDLVVNPPEGFSVAQLYLRGDALETYTPKLLPLTASKDSPALTLKAGAVAAKDNSFDKAVLTTYSTVDPQIYAVVVVLSPISGDGTVTVTEALDQGAAGTEKKVKPGDSCTAPDKPSDTDERSFSSWKLSYRNGGTLSLQPGDSFRPYDDCRVEAQWNPVITITANAPVPSGGSFEPNGYAFSGKLAEGDAIISVNLQVSEDNGQFTSVPSQAVIRNGDRDVTDHYSLRYVNSDPVSKEDEGGDDQPTPKTAITITAKAPVLDTDGKTYIASGAELTGSLQDGDAVASLDYDVKQTEDGYISVPKNAVIKNGETDNTANYEITYVQSPAVKPAAPDKIKITITAKAPVLDTDGKTYIANGAELTGSLQDGDAVASLDYDVKQTEDGYVSVPKNAVIKNGETDNTANYEITYVQSPAVKPAAPDKIKITITAREPVLDTDGKTYIANGALLSGGPLNAGDNVAFLSYDIKQTEDGYISVPHDAVIKNGETDNTANYEITYVQSAAVKPDAEKIAITIRSKDRSAEYSGEQITADAYELVSGALAAGDTIEVKYEGGSTNVTASPVPSTIASVVIKDSAGNDVTQSKYAVTIDNDNAGKVTVTKRSITVTAISGTVETDGTKVIYAKDCKTADGSFKNGHKVENLLPGHELRGDFVKGSGKETFVTSIDLNELRIVDTAHENTDVTANYNVKTVDGKMTIKVVSHSAVPVAVTVSEQSWVYDGTAHKPDQTKYNISGLLDGDTATVTLKVKQGETTSETVTNAGTYTIVAEVTIRTKDGQPVAENKYSVTAGSANLTVKKRDITLEAISDSKPYDGKALINDKVKAPALAAGHKYQGVKLNVYDAKGNLIKNGAKEVGTYTKRITEVHIVDASGTEVTENYNITKIDGTLTITNSSKNDSKTPKTGDANMTVYIVLLIASLLLLGTVAAFLVVRNRKKQAEQPVYDGEYYEPDEQPADWQQPEAPEDYPAEQPPESWTESSRDWNTDPRNWNDR